MIELSPRKDAGTTRNIKIIGIGGAGANALDRMALDGVDPDCLIAANTEAQALVASVAGEKVQLGKEVTRGLGSGGDPELGRCAAEESAAELRSALEGAEAVFILAGLGGGTGSGATSFVAELAREAGALVIALVTLPFGFEGKRRAQQAGEALLALQQQADAVVCFENDRMGDSVAPKAGIQAAFASADLTLSQCVLSLAGLLNRQGLIHLGFDELSAALQGVNARCLFGYGEAEGTNRPFDALTRAFKNPLMDKGRMLRDCETVLVQVSGGADLTLDEVQLLMEEFNRYVNDSTRILFGAAVDPDLEGRLTVTILSSISDEAPAIERPKPVLVQKPIVSAAPKPAPKPEPAVAVEPAKPKAPEAVIPTEPEPEPIVETAPAPVSPSPVVQEEPKAPEPIAAEIKPPVPTPVEAKPAAPKIPEPAVSEPQSQEPPIAPPSRLVKPRGLRRAISQGSLFGDDEPLITPSKIAPPVPGRMLDRPYPKMPVREPEPAPVAETAQAEPAPEPVVEEIEAALAPSPVAIPELEPAPEIESVPEIEPIVAVETEIEAEPEPEAEIEPASELPESDPEPEAEEPSPEEEEPDPVPQPNPVAARPERRPLLTPKPRTPEPETPTPSKTPQQEVLQFEPVTRGRFEKSEPTIVDGQDLDVPTYMRRRIKLR